MIYSFVEVPASKDEQASKNKLLENCISSCVVPIDEISNSCSPKQLKNDFDQLGLTEDDFSLYNETKDGFPLKIEVSNLTGTKFGDQIVNMSANNDI